MLCEGLRTYKLMSSFHSLQFILLYGLWTTSNLSFTSYFALLLQLRVHCAEALGTPIVGDYKYGWFVHRRWKQMPRANFEPMTGEPYKLRRPEGLDVQKGSVLSKVPLLHLHCRELVLPNIEKFLELNVLNSENHHRKSKHSSKPDLLRFVAWMPSHMKISWNLMSSYLVWWWTHYVEIWAVSVCNLVQMVHLHGIKHLLTRGNTW